MYFDYDKLTQAQTQNIQYFRSPRDRKDDRNIRSKKHQQINYNVTNHGNKKHVILMKVFAAITLLFLITHTPILLLSFRLTHNFYIMYIFFINHIGNPVVYFIMMKRFRKEVKVTCMKCVRCKALQ